MKLAEIAGGDAANCGHLKTQGTNEMDAASKCAMQSAQQKRPFYVAYDMPGMTVAVAGNSDGKLFTLQSQAGGAGLVSGACPAELRIAPSGRVTCYAPGTFPMGGGCGLAQQHDDVARDGREPAQAKRPGESSPVRGPDTSGKSAIESP